MVAMFQIISYDIQGLTLQAFLPLICYTPMFIYLFVILVTSRWNENIQNLYNHFFRIRDVVRTVFYRGIYYPTNTMRFVHHYVFSDSISETDKNMAWNGKNGADGDGGSSFANVLIFTISTYYKCDPLQSHVIFIWNLFWTYIRMITITICIKF